MNYSNTLEVRPAWRYEKITEIASSSTTWREQLFEFEFPPGQPENDVRLDCDVVLTMKKTRFGVPSRTKLVTVMLDTTFKDLIFETKFDAREARGKTNCAVCLDRDADHIILPCCHIALCEECSAKKYSSCPMCRGAIESIRKTFQN